MRTHLALKRSVLIAAGLTFFSSSLSAESFGIPTFRTDVDLVYLTFTVMDNRGRYIDNLKPEDFKISEDGTVQEIETFLRPAILAPDATARPGIHNSIYVLVDTSNCMYERFVHASDATIKFMRSLPPTTPVALYTFSRNLARNTPLTLDRYKLTGATRGATLGDNTALYNSILLTIRDAAKQPGGKTIVVFSNGPDDASMVSPDDVARVAQEEGIPIHVISTQNDEISEAAFGRMSRKTGGRLHIASKWDEQTSAFQAIKNDLMNSYTVTYYAKPNPNSGFRKIAVELDSDWSKKYRIRARPGYRPKNEGHRQPPAILRAGNDYE